MNAGKSDLRQLTALAVVLALSGASGPFLSLLAPRAVAPPPSATISMQEHERLERKVELLTERVRVLELQRYQPK